MALGRLFWGVTFVPQSQQLPVLGTGVSGMPPGCNRSPKGKPAPASAQEDAMF